LTFGIRALIGNSERTKGLEYIKKLIAGVFCFWFLWALPVFISRRSSGDFLYQTRGDIFTRAIAILVFISVLFCLGNRDLKELTRKEVGCTVTAILGMLLSLSPLFFSMSWLMRGQQFLPQ